MVTQMLRQGDAEVFKLYSEAKLGMIVFGGALNIVVFLSTKIRDRRQYASKGDRHGNLSILWLHSVVRALLSSSFVLLQLHG
jgi:hypothetical protein